MSKTTGRAIAAAIGLLFLVGLFWLSPRTSDTSFAAPQKVMKHQMMKEHKAERMLARVGSQAPDFELPAYVNGGFKKVKLSDYRGKWVVVCFYPGDSTFV